MDKRTLLIGGAGALLAALVGGPALAAPVPTQVPLGDGATPEMEEVRRGGRGGGRGNRGRHYGWRRGRGHAWGRRRRFGW